MPRQKTETKLEELAVATAKVKGCAACAPKKRDYRHEYFMAAMTGLIARGGMSMDVLIRTAQQYADEAVAAMETK